MGLPQQTEQAEEILKLVVLVAGALETAGEDPEDHLVLDRAEELADLPEEAIHVRVKPKHPPGTRRDQGRIVTDYVELRLDYELPEAQPAP